MIKNNQNPPRPKDEFQSRGGFAQKTSPPHINGYDAAESADNDREQKHHRRALRQRKSP